MKKRLVYIDVYRAVAILLVTGFHLWRPLGYQKLPVFGINDFSYLGFLQNGALGVEVFFIISGFCMASSTSSASNSREYLRYYLNRFLRIAPAYYAAIAIWNVALGLGITKASNSSYDNIMHLLFLHNLDLDTFHSVSGVFWSLAVEMQFYLLLPFLLPLMRGLRSASLVLMAAFLLSLALNVFSDQKLITWSVLSYLFLFVLGAFLAVYRERLSLLNGFFIKAALFGAIVVGLSYIGDLRGIGEIYDILLSSMIAVFMVLNADYIESKADFWLVKGLAFIGLISYSSYLYNYFIYLPVYEVKPYFIINWLAPLVFVFFLGGASYYFVERPANIYRKVLLKRLFSTESKVLGSGRAVK